MIWQTLPTKRQAPVEVASVVVLAVRGRFDELKGVEVDRGDVGTHDGGAVRGDPGQQRLQPPVEAFTLTDVEQMLCQYSRLHVAGGQAQPRPSKGRQGGVAPSVKGGRVGGAFSCV